VYEQAQLAVCKDDVLLDLQQHVIFLLQQKQRLNRYTSLSAMPMCFLTGSST
jgi:hypothetical protein